MLLSNLFPQDSHINPVNEVRLDLLLKQTEVTGFLSIVLAGLLALLMYDTEHGFGMVIWVLAIAAVFVFRRVFFYEKIHVLRKAGRHHFEYYHAVIIFFLFISGITWGVGAYLYLPSEHHVEFFVTFLTALVGITAGNMPSFAPSLIGFLVFMIPTLSGAALRLYGYEYYVLFSGLIIYMGYLILTVVRMSRVVIHAISTDIKNEILLKEVTIEKEKAQMANAEKSRFLAAASHDLRQPLNSMGLFLYALGKQLENPQHSKQDKSEVSLFNKINHSYQALKSLFDSLLEVSRLDAGNVDVDMRPLTLTGVVSPIVDELTEQAHEKGLDIIYRSSGKLVQADRVLFARIMRNLIGNAIKYTKKGSISIVETINNNRLTIAVMDTGIGIPKSELDNIFNEYEQLANTRRDRREGIGLGLSIVKKMAQLMGYKVKVTSTLGEGSSFSIELLLAQEKSPQISHSKAVISRLDTITYSPKNSNILVIDDEPDILEAMSLLITAWGYRVVCAHSYQSALSALQDNEPDLILCDYRLQDNMNGIQALLKLAAHTSKPVDSIIITGDTDPDILEHIHGNGFICIHKPIDPEQLQKQMKKLLIRTEA